MTGQRPRRRALSASLEEVRSELEEVLDRLEDSFLEEWEEIEDLAEAAARHARRVVLLVVGSTIVLIGAVLVLTPLPGSPLIFAGVSILAVEFAWARRWRVRLEKAAAEALVELRDRLDFFDDDEPDAPSVPVDHH